MKKFNIAVIGSGVAGSVTAIGLKKLGYNVTVFSKKRAFESYEGFSQKSKDGLEMNGCFNASSLLNEKSLRSSNWANEKNKINYEYVVSRRDLDEMLIKDLNNYGIDIVESTKLNDINSFDYVVDARGRFTPFKSEYITGPKTISILLEYEFEKNIQSQTSIDSCENGWIWQAKVDEKKGYIQFSCDEKFANRVKNVDDFKEIIKSQKIDLWVEKNAIAKEKFVKRDSFCKLHKFIVDEKMILVGDSASSIDPLSGNGAFQALSMASVAPYVINTILTTDEKSKNVAIAFYKNRVKQIFEKFTNVGKSFYALEDRFNNEFWNIRKQWAYNDGLDEKSLPMIMNKAVVNVPLIKESKVLITSSKPQGVAYYGDLYIVELCQFCLDNDFESAVKFFDNFCENKSLETQKIQLLKSWLEKENILQSNIT